MNLLGPRDLTIMVVPDDGSVSRSYRITYGRVRLLIVVGLVAGIMFVGMAGSWWYLAARAARVSDLEVRLEAMGHEQVRLEAVGADLAAAEEQYARLRSLLVPSLPPGDGGIWLPLSGGRASDGESGGVGVSGATIPNVWPLSEKGLITQGLLQGVEGSTRAWI